MLVEAIRLTHRADAFASDYTPFTLIRQILEREGEFNEWQDEMTMSFGGFGLNYAAVGPVRESALDYLDFVLEGDGSLALHAVSVMQDLLHHFLNRVGRQSTEHEKYLAKSGKRALSPGASPQVMRGRESLLKAKIYNALRSATAINCPEPVRQAAGRSSCRYCCG